MLLDSNGEKMPLVDGETEMTLLRTGISWPIVVSWLGPEKFMAAK